MWVLEGWSGSLQLPVPSPFWESVWGDTASPQHVSGAGGTLAGYAGCTLWLSQLLLWAGADGRRWRQHWVPLPPAAFPCIPGEEGWESHCLYLQQLHLLPACHLCPGAVWDAQPMSPSVLLPAGRQEGNRLAWEHNRATLSTIPDGGLCPSPPAALLQQRLSTTDCGPGCCFRYCQHLLPLYVRLLLTSSC